MVRYDDKLMVLPEQLTLSAGRRIFADRLERFSIGRVMQKGVVPWANAYSKDRPLRHMPGKQS